MMARSDLIAHHSCSRDATLIPALLLPILLAFAGDPAFDPTSSYRERTIEGFRVLVNPKVEAHEAEAAAAIDELAKQLRDVNRVVAPAQLAAMKKVTIWVEWEAKPGGAAEFHPSRDWLKSHGYNPEKAGGVEINNARNFVKWSRTTQPSMVLHELAHAYHRLVLKGDRRVEAAYRHAVEGKKYESVKFIAGGKRRAYALTDVFEYFAEATEAYLGKNDFDPFTREDLEAFDPEAFRLMREVWGEAKS